MPTSPALPATRTRSVRLTSGRRIRFVEWIFKRDCGAVQQLPRAQQECPDVTKNGTSAITPEVMPKPVTTATATVPPTVQGLAMEDEILRATGGTWTGPGTITKAIFWQRCNTAGEGCATVVGATGPTYRLTAADVGTRIRVIETASNEGGAAQSPSTPTAVVDELRPDGEPAHVARTKVDLPHRLVLNEVVTKQTGRHGDAPDQGLRQPRLPGQRRPGRVTPTGLLAGSAAPKTSLANGWATFTFRATGTGPPTCSSRPAGRARSRKQASRPRTCSGSGSTSPLGVGGFLPKHV